MRNTLTTAACALLLFGCNASDEKESTREQSPAKTPASKTVQKPEVAKSPEATPSSTPEIQATPKPFAFANLNAKVIVRSEQLPIEITGTSLEGTKVFARQAENEVELPIATTSEKITIAPEALTLLPAGEVELILRKEGESEIVIPSKLEVE